MPRSVVRRALVSALVVGAALTAINHGPELLRGDVDAGMTVRVALTFVVPFVVSLVASATAIRDVRSRS